MSKRSASGELDNCDRKKVKTSKSDTGVREVKICNQNTAYKESIKQLADLFEKNLHFLHGLQDFPSEFNGFVDQVAECCGGLF